MASLSSTNSQNAAPGCGDGGGGSGGDGSGNGQPEVIIDAASSALTEQDLRLASRPTNPTNSKVTLDRRNFRKLGHGYTVTDLSDAVASGLRANGEVNLADYVDLFTSGHPAIGQTMAEDIATKANFMDISTLLEIEIKAAAAQSAMTPRERAKAHREGQTNTTNQQSGLILHLAGKLRPKFLHDCDMTDQSDIIDLLTLYRLDKDNQKQLRLAISFVITSASDKILLSKNPDGFTLLVKLTAGKQHFTTDAIFDALKDMCTSPKSPQAQVTFNRITTNMAALIKLARSIDGTMTATQLITIIGFACASNILAARDPASAILVNAFLTNPLMNDLKSEALLDRFETDFVGKDSRARHRVTEKPPSKKPDKLKLKKSTKKQNNANTTAAGNKNDNDNGSGGAGESKTSTTHYFGAYRKAMFKHLDDPTASCSDAHAASYGSLAA